MKNLSINRRDFLKGSAALGIMSAATMAVPALAEPEVPAYPYEFKPVTDEKIIEHSWDCYRNRSGCCAAVFGGILESMAEAYGYPYNLIPTSMFANGGGGYTAGSLCGTLGGAAAVFGLFCPPADARALSKKLFAWYSVTSFPTFESGYDLPLSVANSVNCADSLGTWCAVSGFAKGTPEQSARCGALSAEVAVKAHELLCIHFGLKEEPVEAPAEQAANQYIGVGTSSIGGEIKVRVTVDGGKITAIDVLSHGETPGISDPAFAEIPAKVIEAQSADVDCVSGATCTSQALIDAIKNALSQVK